MKKGLLITLIVIGAFLALMAFVLFNGMGSIRAMQVPAVDLTRLSDGTYKGAFSRGRWSYAVEVTMKGGRIESIALQDPKKLDDLARKAIAQVIEKQSVTVDAVSGASISSKAFYKAVENALEHT